MKPAQRSLGIGFDHIETVGGRHRYVRHMMSHADRMAKVKPVIDISAPKAAFGGGAFRTPSAAGQTGKAAARTEEAFAEVREAFRRVREVHQGSRRTGGGASSGSGVARHNEHADLASKISRNRKLGSRQHLLDTAHAAELYHQQRRIAEADSLTERKKNKLDPSLYPVLRMRTLRHASAAELLADETARKAGLPPRPHSARATVRDAATDGGCADACGERRLRQSRRRRPCSGRRRAADERGGRRRAQAGGCSGGRRRAKQERARRGRRVVRRCPRRGRQRRRRDRRVVWRRLAGQADE